LAINLVFVGNLSGICWQVIWYVLVVYCVL